MALQITWQNLEAQTAQLLSNMERPHHAEKIIIVKSDFCGKI